MRIYPWYKLRTSCGPLSSMHRLQSPPKLLAVPNLIDRNEFLQAEKNAKAGDFWAFRTKRGPAL